VIIGAAFGAIVTSFVNDVLMPPIGLLLGRVDFSNLFLSLDGQSYPSLAAAQEAEAPTLNYGVLINTIINFLIVAFAIFLAVRVANRIAKKKKRPLQPPPPKTAPIALPPSRLKPPAARTAHLNYRIDKDTFHLAERRAQSSH